MRTYVLEQRGGELTLRNLTEAEQQSRATLCCAPNFRSFVRLREGQDLVVSVETPRPLEAA